MHWIFKNEFDSLIKAQDIDDLKRRMDAKDVEISDLKNENEVLKTDILVLKRRMDRKRVKIDDLNSRFYIIFYCDRLAMLENAIEFASSVVQNTKRRRNQ